MEDVSLSMQDIGKHLKILRRNSKFSIDEIALILGIEPLAYYQMENGKRILDQDSRQMLLDLYKTVGNHR